MGINEVDDECIHQIKARLSIAVRIHPRVDIEMRQPMGCGDVPINGIKPTERSKKLGHACT